MNPVTERTSPPTFGRGAVWLAGAIVVGAALAAYHNSFHGPFVFDDLAIATNPSIRRLGALGDVLSPPSDVGLRGRPVANLSLALNYAAGGFDVRGYHVANFLIHAAAALALFGLVRRTLARTRFAAGALVLGFAAALLWAVHPLTTASVTYVSQRTESLMALFYLLTLYGLARAAESPRPDDAAETRRRRGWMAVSVSAGLLGMGTKESMVTAPLVALLYDRTFFAGAWTSALRLRGGFYGALAATWLLLGYELRELSHHTVGYTFGVSAGDYALTQCVALTRYLGLALWPHPLIFDYGREAMVREFSATWPLVILIAWLLGATAWLWRCRPELGFLGAVFFAILAPSSSVVPVALQPIAENRMYLPLAALAVGGVLAGRALLGRWALAVAAMVALGLGVLTARRNALYADPVTLLSDTVAKQPGNARAQSNLGYVLAAAGRLPEAIARGEAALRLAPDDAETHNNLGLALVRTGRAAEAVPHYEAALRANPRFAAAANNLGVALAELGRPDEAVRSYEHALRIDPADAEAHNNLAILLGQLDRLAEAGPHYEAALRVRPGSADIHYNYGNLLYRTRRFAAAAEHYTAAIATEPDSPELHGNLGAALLELGRTAEAVREFEAALRLRPDYALAREALGRLRAGGR